MISDFDKERRLEQKYQGVLAYTEAKGFLRETPYTSAKITGAVKRFIKAEGIEKPKNFTEMESFVNSLVDFYLDANPEAHTDGEFILHQSVSNYIAFSQVWKIKARTSTILDPDLMGTVGNWLAARSSLASMSMVIPSMAKRANGYNKELYDQMKQDLPYIFQSFYITGHALSKGKVALPENKSQEAVTRMIGAFYAGDKGIIEAVEKLDQIENKKDFA
ncbi:hypothetical protein [Desulfobacula sp.]|uniref:hypothetical protein n=1 Tax=Desulfobacula sp. TaxID=2593537 RepID=UPI0026261638|nr:hypothetical protein [Desulfobacula sp.]